MTSYRETAAEMEALLLDVGDATQSLRCCPRFEVGAKTCALQRATSMLLEANPIQRRRAFRIRAQEAIEEARDVIAVRRATMRHTT